MSGSPDKLKRYKALGVQQVWFWEAGEISIYQLAPTDYQKPDESQFVKGIDFKQLVKCVAIESRPQSVREFRQPIRGVATVTTT